LDGVETRPVANHKELCEGEASPVRPIHRGYIASGQEDGLTVDKSPVSLVHLLNEAFADSLYVQCEIVLLHDNKQGGGY
jgi:hypothetical protein